MSCLTLVNHVQQQPLFRRSDLNLFGGCGDVERSMMEGNTIPSITDQCRVLTDSACVELGLAEGGTKIYLTQSLD